MRLAMRNDSGTPIVIGSVYTIGLNYDDPADPGGVRPERPLVYGKASSSVIGDGSVISWDRSLTANVSGECELGVVVGANSSILGYTIVNDLTSQDPWFDGDQWLIGKSMPGFCPVGPWIVAADKINVSDVRLSLQINGTTIQDGRTSQMRFSIAEIVAYLTRHVDLRVGDLIATGNPVRIGPLAERHLEPGDVMTCWIEGIGELTNTVR